MLNDFAAVDGNELWNTTRLQAYLTNVGSPFDTGPDICTCPDLTPAILGETFPAYQTPVLDPAPWYDADTPASGEYLGFLPLNITGLDDNPTVRTVTNAVGGGGVFGPARDLPRTITVTGIVIGSTCCGAGYGIQYLAEAMGGCTGGVCDGGCLNMYDCCPDSDTVTTPAQFNAAHRRTFRRTALVSGPTVVRRDGTGSCKRTGCAGGEIVTVEFVLVAASPWAWTDPLELLDVGLPIGSPSSPCVSWCVKDPAVPGSGCPDSDCLFADCAADTGCPDPMNPVPSPPLPTSPPTAFCVPVASESACYTVDLSTRPHWSTDMPVITVTAGSTDLRNIRILLFERIEGNTATCDVIADASRCAPQNEFLITYLQAGGTITVDGQIGKAVAECKGDCGTSTTTYGDQNGGPVRINGMTCAMYCLCVESDPSFPPGADAKLSFAVSGRGF